MKTILEIAREVAMPKQRLYRIIKKHSIEVHQKDGVMYLDAAAENKLKSHLYEDTPYQRNTSKALPSASDAVEVIRLYERENELLRQQLQTKDEQIAALQQMLQQEQERNRPWYQRLFLPAPKGARQA